MSNNNKNNNQIVTAESVTGLATHFLNSGWFKDVTDLSKAVVKIMAGQELGIGPMASMTGINIIEGKPVLASNLLASQIKSSQKYNYKVKERTSTKCTIEFFEKFGDNFESIGEAEFTVAEATKAGLSGKNNWRNYASDMLFARAISRGARTHCPDIFNGSVVYVPGELSPDNIVKTELPSLATQPQIEEIETLILIQSRANQKDPALIRKYFLDKLSADSFEKLTIEGADLFIKKLKDINKEVAKV
jgi:hypothetical protein